MLKIGRVNHPTSLPFSRYLYSQFPYFQGATYSEPRQILPGDVMSNCTNRDSSTFLICFLQLLQIDKAYIRDWLFWTLATRLRGAPSLSYKALTHFIKLLAW